MDGMFHASSSSDGAATPVKSHGSNDERRHGATPMGGGAPCTPGAPSTPHLQVVGSGLLSAYATTPLTQPSCLGAAQKPIPMPLSALGGSTRQENAKSLSQFDPSKRLEVAKKLDAWDATTQSPFKRRCLDKELDSAARAAEGKRKLSRVPVVDFRSLAGLGSGNSDPGHDDSSDEEDEDEICTLRTTPQEPMRIPELMMRHGTQAAQRTDSSGASSATAATAWAVQGVQRHCVADFGALVASKGPLPRRTRLDDIVEALDLHQPAYFEEDDALLASSSDDEEDEPCVLRQAPVVGLGSMFKMLQQRA